MHKQRESAFWASFKAVPARAISAAASAAARRKHGRKIAATNQAEKQARIDGSSNRALGGDCNTTPRRVEFASDKYRAKETQPAQIDGSLVGYLMAKLMVSENGGVQAEMLKFFIG